MNLGSIKISIKVSPRIFKEKLINKINVTYRMYELGEILINFILIKSRVF